MCEEVEVRVGAREEEGGAYMGHYILPAQLFCKSKTILKKKKSLLITFSPKKKEWRSQPS